MAPLIFAAPRASVWEAWTDATELAKWLFAEEGYRATDVEMRAQMLAEYHIVVEPPEGWEEI